MALRQQQIEDLKNLRLANEARCNQNESQVIQNENQVIQNENQMVQNENQVIQDENQMIQDDNDQEDQLNQSNREQAVRRSLRNRRAPERFDALRFLGGESAGNDQSLYESADGDSTVELEI